MPLDHGPGNSKLNESPRKLWDLLRFTHHGLELGFSMSSTFTRGVWVVEGGYGWEMDNDEGRRSMNDEH